MFTALAVFASTSVSLFILSLLLHVPARLGPAGKALSTFLTRAPGLDIVVTTFTIVPMIVGASVGGWLGFLGALLGQYVALGLWTIAHELAHPEHRNGPRIVKINNKLVGWPRNIAALLVNSGAVPIFFFIRCGEVLLYPWLVWLVKFPPYRQSEWVQVSRQKYTGLVGHDRIWCLYCDWMTGVWSLGGEMLRNVESFWCPIRFRSDLKCDHCHNDYPDINNGWVDAGGDMKAVTDKLEEKYITDQPKHNAWFGHPVRLTVKGKNVDGPG
jgi:hypothetical protein